MEFLVNIEVRWPAEGDAKVHAGLVRAEAARASELSEQRVIKRLWRVPGRRENYGLWDAENADELHDAIASLPFYPWLDVRVVPLAAHPSDPSKKRGT